MIYDSIQNLAELVPQYAPNVRTLVEFLKLAQKKTFEELREMDFFPLDVRFDEYTTKAVGENLLEAHRKYWDLQLLMEGAEHIGYAPIETLTEKTPYDAIEDIAFYEGTFQTVRLGGGMAILLAPWDAHLPQLALHDHPSHVKKIVVKLSW